MNANNATPMDAPDLDLEAWRRAKTLEDVGELTARWLEGTLRFHPCYGGGPDEETAPLTAALAEFNRRGFVTLDSQPAAALTGCGFAQRAFVSGYARKETAMRLAALTLHTDLLVLAVPALHEGGCYIPVTVGDFRPYSWAGSYPGEDELKHFADACSPEAVEDLVGSWSVEVVDPQWGRADYLWRWVGEALRGVPAGRGPWSAAPHPDLNLDGDFAYC